MKVIFIQDCTGEDLQHTLVQQLYNQGVLKSKAMWGPKGENDPTSIFWHFRHYPAQRYTPSHVSKAKDFWHCGVCYKKIDYLYHCYSDSGKPFMIEWVDTDGEKYYIMYPAKMTCGSSCIHLPDDLISLVNKCYEDLGAETVLFRDGRIQADPIVKNAANWKADAMAFPLEWFWFTHRARKQLMLGQQNCGRGLHVEQQFEGSARQKCARALAYYRGNIEEEKAFISGSLYKGERRLTTAYSLFYGKDKFGKMCRLSIDDEYRQTCESQKYVILTREQAESLAKEI